MTFHEDAARGMIEDLDPGDVERLTRLSSELREGGYNRQLIAWVGQTQRGPAYWPAHQVAALEYVLSGLVAGRIARRRIRVGAGPGPDADREGNAALLRKVEEPFHARVDMTQNGADSDGSFSWDGAINLWRVVGPGLLSEPGIYGALHAPFEVRPWTAPLEIGYTLPSRTMAHLMVEGVVARWAYDDDEICLLVDLPRVGGARGVRPLPAGVEPFSLSL